MALFAYGSGRNSNDEKRATEETMGAGLLTLAVLTLAPSQPAPAMEEQIFDFRQGKVDPLARHVGREMEKYVSPETEGLRITLPPSDKRYTFVGVQPQAWVHGDFEITLTYQILQAGRPRNGDGAKVNLTVTLPENGEYIYIERYWSAMYGDIVWVDHRYNNPPGPPQHDRFRETASENAGKLRLKRTGKELSGLFAEGTSDDFTEVARFTWAATDVDKVRAGVNEGGASSVTTDVRLQELKVRTGTWTPETPNAAGSQAASTPEPSAARGFWLAIELLGLGLALTLLIALGIWGYRRHCRRVDNKPTPAQAAATTVSFPCAACGKQLKATPKLAGKKVKCTNCGQPVLVPLTGANDAAHPS
jgi:DNA-directed RNA polymerase subunit RPC12/RpoP